MLISITTRDDRDIPTVAEDSPIEDSFETVAIYNIRVFDVTIKLRLFTRFKCLFRFGNCERSVMEVEKSKRTEYSSLQMTRKRELGQIFQNDTLSSKYYKYIQIKSSWSNDKSSTDHGGIFNLKFSPSGKMLVAACEKATILILDPVSRKLIHRVENAHCDSVNCICFLDERTFASGSDDSNIMLWGARMLREHVTKLEGHTRWVKSVQYDRISRHLVTSAFDDTVRIWDINRYSHGQPKSNIIYRAKRLIRMQLSTACDKLIVSTFGGTLTVFHNLDLENFQQDMNKRELLSHLNNGKDSPKLLSLDRNEPETIMEFPHPPWCVSSLQVHPQGWCLLSRYSSDHRQDEYSTIHDIQTVPHGKVLLFTFKNFYLF